MTLQSYESTGAGHPSAAAAPKPIRTGRQLWFRSPRDSCGLRLFFFDAAEQFFAHDHVEPRLLIGIEDGAHFEDVRDGVPLRLAHGIVKPINRLAEAFALGVVFGDGRGYVARGRAQLCVKRCLARGVTSFNRLQPSVLFGRQIKFAMNRCVESVSMRIGPREACADEHASQSCAEPDDGGENKQLPSLQHDLPGDCGGGRIGLIERKRSKRRRSRCCGGRYANGRADQKDKGANARDSAAGAGARAGPRARINSGPDVALQPVQCCVDVHPAQSGELAIKVGQGSLRAITLFYTRAAARALGRASPSGSAEARTRRPRRKCRDLIQSKARMQVRRDLVMGPRSSRPARRS